MKNRTAWTAVAGAGALLASTGVAASPPARSTTLDGLWTNVSITPFERAPAYGTRRAHTDAEVRQLEGAAVERFKEGNAPTDPNQGAEDQTSKKCKSADGLDCGYNSGWKDSGVALMRVGGEARTSFITTGDGRVPPRMATAKRLPAFARDPESRTENPEDRALGERCLTSFGFSGGPVMLPLMYNNTYQVVQTGDDVAIVVEMVHDVRHVRIGGQHRTDGVRPWFGDSVGRWEGKTLVAETTNYHPLQAQYFRGADENLKVEERFTRVSPTRMRYGFTVTDPTVWAQPWGGEYEFEAAKGPVFEYACHEGNYAMHGILAGARAKERAAGAPQKVAARED